MRILHVVPSYLPAVRYGGPIFAVHGLARALAAAGHDVHVATTSVDGPGDSDVPIGRPVAMDGVSVRYFRASPLRRLYHSPAMARALRADVASFDVVHTHSVFLWPTWMAARAARDAGVPYVAAPRGMLVRELVRRKSSLAKRAWIAAIERANLEGAAAIHATSDEEAERLREFGFRLPPVEVIPNGVDADESPRRAARLADELLYLGRVNWKKGLDRLIPALRSMPQARLVVAGNDEEGYAPALRDIARASGVEGRVEFTGPVYGERKAELLARATLLVLPSYSENFGNVVLEALAAGCPVAVTAAVGLAPFVRETGAGAVVPGEPAELGPALARLLGDPAGLAAMGSRGRAAVRERFAWPVVARRMELLYERIRAQRERYNPASSPCA